MFNKLEAATFYLFLLLSGKCQWPPCGNQSGQQNKIMLFSGLYIYFLNLYSLIYFHPMGLWRSSKQYHNNVFYAGQRGNYSIVYPAMFLHLLEHLASRYVILLYIRLTMKNLIVESIQSIYNSLWTWHDKCNICCRYCIYHVKFNVCLVTKLLVRVSVVRVSVVRPRFW